jgi:WD40 repeat protein/tRNA A-37 threonylcarbamoyl transferase component Bud32
VGDVETGEHRPDAPTAPSAATVSRAQRTLPAIPGYEIEGELGRGGMGVVYKARHLRLHRICALKMVLAGPHAAPEALVRFLTEAEAVAKLRHPHIVAIHQIGEYDGLPFIELEYLAGGSLAEQLDGTPRPPRRAAELIETLAGAVRAAHEAGVVHRDLKPANVLMDDDGTPKVADFGVAKALGAETGLTATDSILGSPSYMAPEQAGGRSREVGPAADMYALGAILYELLTGRPPFRGATVLETLEQVKTTEPVPPSRLVPGLPRDIETIALKCLEKVPERRYGSARELADELGRYLRGEPILARPIGPIARGWRWCRRNQVVAGLLALLALSFVAGFAGVSGQWLRADRQREALRRQNAITSVKLALSEYEAANIAVAAKYLNDCPPDLRFWEWNLVQRLCHREQRTFGGHAWNVWDVAFSPGGDRIASVAGGFYYSRQPGLGELLIRDAATGQVIFERRGLRHGLRAAAFDPVSEGRYLATGGGLWVSKSGIEEEASVEASILEGRLDVWDAKTGERRSLDAVDGRIVIDVAYSPDGAVLAAAYGFYDEPGYARLWDVATGEPIGGPFAGSPGGVSAVAFSPDGRWLALAAGFEREGRYRIEVWDWRKRELACPPFGADSRVNHLAFGPEGRFLASAEEESRLIRLWDVAAGKEIRTFQGHESLVRAVAFRPDGKIVASCGEDHLVKLWDVATGLEVETLRGHPSFILSLAFDSEGRRLASGDLSGSVKVWSAEGGQPLRLKADGWAYRLVFHPDGKRLLTAAWLNSRDFEPRLWDADTGRLVRSFRGHGGPVASVTLSRDGSRMATASFDQTARVWDVETGRQLAVLDLGRLGFVWDIAFHPQDDTRLATACADGTIQLWTIDPTGGMPPTSSVLGRLNTPIKTLAFRPPLGRELAAGAGDGSVHVWNVETKEEVRAISDLGKPVPDVAFSADGSLLATANSGDLFVDFYRPASVTVYDWEAGRVRFTLPLSEAVSGVAFSPDGTRLATACSDKTVKLWDMATGQDVLTLRGHVGSVFGVAFSPDGRRLASAGILGTVLVWDATPGGPARNDR